MTYDGPSGKIALLGHEERQSASNGDDRISLDGAWDFLHTVEDYRAPPVEWRRIDVPGPWQAQFADLRKSASSLSRRGISSSSGGATFTTTSASQASAGSVAILAPASS